MSKTLKLEISVADLGQNGVVVSEFATTDYVANELSKKATLNDEGKVDPSLLPDYTYLDGLVDKLDDVEQSFLNSDAEILNAAKLYSDNKITENNSKKADLVEGKVPFEQLPFSMNFEQNVSTEFGNVRQELRQNSESIVSQMDGLVDSANSYTDGKVLEEREFLNNTINEYKGEVNSQLNNFGNEIGVVKNTQDHIINNGASLPYNPDLEYVDGALTLKDGEIQQFVGGIWTPFNKTVNASDVIDESGLRQQEWNNGVESIADLLAITNPKNGSRVYVKGYREATNLALAKPYNGGSDFVFISENAGVNNGITIFNGWMRLGITDHVTPEMAGAYANDINSDADAFDIAIQYAHANNLQVHALGATYYIDREVNVLTGKSYGTQGTIIKGAGKAKTFIRIAKDVDCFNITNIDQLSFATNVRITDLSFKQTGTALKTGVALKTNANLTNVVLDEISFFECKQAIKFPNQFYIARLTSLHAQGCTYGFELGLEGTTLFLDNLFVTGGGGASDSFAYKVRASYTTIGSLACDFFNGASYDFAWGQYSIGALGLEGLQSRPSKVAISFYKASFKIANIKLVGVNALLSSDRLIYFSDAHGSIGVINTVNSNATSPAKLLDSFNSVVEIEHLTGTTTYAKPTYLNQANVWGVSINGFKYQRGDMRPQIGLANNSLVDNIVSKTDPCKQSFIFDIYGASFNSSGYTGEQDWQWLPAPSLGDWGIQRRPDLFGIAATVSLASGGICRDRTDAQKGTLPLIVYAKPSTPTTGCIYIDKTTKKVEIFITDSWVLLN